MACRGSKPELACLFRPMPESALLKTRMPASQDRKYRTTLRALLAYHGYDADWIRALGASIRIWLRTESDSTELNLLFEHDLRAKASRLSRGKTGFHYSGSCSNESTPQLPSSEEEG
jgi:hypothetical protein